MALTEITEGKSERSLRDKKETVPYHEIRELMLDVNEQEDPKIEAEKQEEFKKEQEDEFFKLNPKVST